MKINLDRLIPEALRDMSEESLRYLETLFKFNVPMRVGIRKNRKERYNYRLLLTVESWGKYARKGGKNAKSRVSRKDV